MAAKGAKMARRKTEMRRKRVNHKEREDAMPRKKVDDIKKDLMFENPFGITGTDFIFPVAASQGIIWKATSTGPDYDTPEAKDVWGRIKDLTVEDMLGFAGFKSGGGDKPKGEVAELSFKDADYIGQVIGKYYKMDYPKRVWVCCCCPI